MTPTTPRESRNASSSSPITTIFFGGPIRRVHAHSPAPALPNAEAPEQSHVRAGTLIPDEIFVRAADMGTACGRFWLPSLLSEDMRGSRIARRRRSS